MERLKIPRHLILCSVLIILSLARFPITSEENPNNDRFGPIVSLLIGQSQQLLCADWLECDSTSITADSNSYIPDNTIVLCIKRAGRNNTVQRLINVLILRFQRKVFAGFSKAKLVPCKQFFQYSDCKVQLSRTAFFGTNQNQQLKQQQFRDLMLDQIVLTV